MKNISSLGDLLVYELQNLYAAEAQLLQALPGIINTTKNGSLQKALRYDVDITTQQQQRLQKIAGMLKASLDISSSEAAKGMKGLLDELNALLQQQVNEDVLDAAVIAGVQKIKHYQISTYGIALAYAKQLHDTKAAELLQESLDEAYDADELLTQLATSVFNKKADTKHEGEKSITIETDAAEGYRPDHEPRGHSTKDIREPGGRAGRSHRSYPDGTSRGH